MKRVVVLGYYLCLLYGGALAQLQAEELDNPLGSVAILHEGRLKPLDTFARVQLLGLQEKRKLPDQAAIDWLGMLLTRPEEVHKRPVFKLRNQALLNALDVAPRQDHNYRYLDLSPALHAQRGLIQSLHERPRDSLSLVERQLLDLDQRVFAYEILARSLTCFFPRIQVDSPGLATRMEVVPGTRVSYYHFIRKRETLRELIFAIQHKDPNAYSTEETEMVGLLDQLKPVLADRRATLLTIIPPAGEPQTNPWLSPWELLIQQVPTPAQVEGLALLNEWVQVERHGNHVAAQGHLGAYQQWVTAQCGPAVSWKRIALEAWDNRAGLFHKSVAFYILGLLLLALFWFFGKHRWRKVAFGALLIGIGCHLGGLLTRILIMQRPPVSSLYESILFVSFIGVLGCTILEGIRKNGIGLFCATVIGITLQMVGFRYAVDGDTKGMLVAVLNSNFWLGTHVITITTGYGCTLIAGLVGHVYLAKRLLHPQDETGLKTLSKNMGGLALIALFFTLFGTILGGIWADQSWGRFWGWDPKENGALLIVLWLMLLLHGRVAKQIQPLGFACGLVLANICVALAWFGVNLLSVGLHSYGFTENIATNLLTFCSFEVCFSGAGYIAVRLRERSIRSPGL